MKILQYIKALLIYKYCDYDGNFLTKNGRDTWVLTLKNKEQYKFEAELLNSARFDFFMYPNPIKSINPDNYSKLSDSEKNEKLNIILNIFRLHNITFQLPNGYGGVS